jgi:hypothetical protein
MSSFLNLEDTHAILSGSDGGEPVAVTADSDDPFEPFEQNVIAVRFGLSRDMAILAGVVEPTPQERAGMAADRERCRAERAARVVRQAEWFSTIHDAAGPVGAAMLALHVPDKYDDCKGCGFEELAGLAWPCATVLAGAEAVGLPEPAWF